MTKPPWQQDLEDDEADIRLDAILATIVVLVSTLACTFVLFTLLGYFWPDIMALYESTRFAP